MPRVNQGPYQVMITRPGLRCRGRNAGQMVNMTREAAYAMVDRRDGYIVSGPGLPTRAPSSGRNLNYGPTGNRAVAPPSRPHRGPVPAGEDIVVVVKSIELPKPYCRDLSLDEFLELPYKDQQGLCKAAGLTCVGKTAMADAWEEYEATFTPLEDEDA